MPPHVQLQLVGALALFQSLPPEPGLRWRQKAGGGLQWQVAQGLPSLSRADMPRAKATVERALLLKEGRINQSSGHQTRRVAVQALRPRRPGPGCYGYDARMLAFSCAQAFSASLNCARTLESGEWAGMLRMWLSLRTAALNPLPPWMSPCATAPRGALATGGLAFFAAEDALRQAGNIVRSLVTGPFAWGRCVSQVITAGANTYQVPGHSQGIVAAYLAGFGLTSPAATTGPAFPSSSRACCIADP